MTEPVPTQLGDVLILRTDQSIAVYAVGQITKDGQQDFHGQANVRYESDAAVAIALAKTLVAPGRRMFIRNPDIVGDESCGGDWLEISK